MTDGMKISELSEVLGVDEPPPLEPPPPLDQPLLEPPPLVAATTETVLVTGVAEFPAASETV